MIEASLWSKWTVGKMRGEEFFFWDCLIGRLGMGMGMGGVGGGRWDVNWCSFLGGFLMGV